MAVVTLPWEGGSWIDTVLLVCIATPFAVFAYMAIKHRKAFFRSTNWSFRREASRAFLLERGWNLVRTGIIEWTRPLAVKPLAGDGDPAVTDFAWGVSDGAVCAAFVAYVDGNVRVAIEMADLARPLPPLVLCRSEFDYEFTPLASSHPILSESAEFNARWVVRARDARYASAVLSPRFMERLLQDDTDDMSLAIDGGALMSISRNGVIQNDRIAAHLAVLGDLLRVIPPAVYADFATGAPGNSWRWAPVQPAGAWRWVTRVGGSG